MPKKIKLDCYELMTMTDEEIKAIKPEEFSVFGTQMVKASFLSQLPIATWDKLTYEQLSHMNLEVFVYLKDEILELLIQKFKDNSQMTEITKQIKDKRIKIQSAPLWYRFKNAQIKRQKMKKELNEAKKAYSQLLEYNDYDDETIIPKSLIRKALMIESILNEDDSETITKREYLIWLSSKRNSKTDSHLIKIPHIASFYYVSFDYDMDYLVKYFQNASKEGMDTFKIGKKLYMNYEDILRIIIEI